MCVERGSSECVQISANVVLISTEPAQSGYSKVHQRTLMFDLCCTHMWPLTDSNCCRVKRKKENLAIM